MEMRVSRGEPRGKFFGPVFIDFDGILVNLRMCANVVEALRPYNWSILINIHAQKPLDQDPFIE